ncbi:UNVERIFIED_ORG: hypothetical protein FHW05_003527 [Pantoea agglomerans]
MKRRTRIYYTPKQKAIIWADISKVIPFMISPECSTYFTLLLCLQSTRQVATVLSPTVSLSGEPQEKERMIKRAQGKQSGCLFGE